VKKIDLYIIRVISKPFFSTLFILVGMIWLLQSIRLMDLVINKNMNIIDFLLMSVLLIPGMMIIILPLSFFSGVYGGLKKMVLDSEMDAIYSAGISRLRVLLPLFVVSIIAVGATYFISLYAMPAGRIKFAEVKSDLMNKSDSLQLEAGTFNKITNNITIYVKKIENNQWMKNIIVYDNTNADLPVTWTAEEGVLKLNKNNHPNLFLINGTRQEIGPEQTSVLGFKSHQIDLSKQSQTKEARSKKSSERFLLELLNTDNLTIKQKDKFLREFYKRLLWPLAPLVLMLIPLFFLFKPVKSRFGISRPSIYAIVCAVGFVVVQMFLNSKITTDSNMVAYLAILWPFLVSIFFIGLLVKEKFK
jgi:lipopolysaccharide export system permease protein